MDCRNDETVFFHPKCDIHSLKFTLDLKVLCYKPSTKKGHSYE